MDSHQRRSRLKLSVPTGSGCFEGELSQSPPKIRDCFMLFFEMNPESRAHHDVSKKLQPKLCCLCFAKHSVSFCKALPHLCSPQILFPSVYADRVIPLCANALWKQIIMKRITLGIKQMLHISLLKKILIGAQHTSCSPPSRRDTHRAVRPPPNLASRCNRTTSLSLEAHVNKQHFSPFFPLFLGGLLLKQQNENTDCSITMISISWGSGSLQAPCCLSLELRMAKATGAI